MKSQTLEESNILQDLRNNPTSRRAFLKTMGAAGLGLAAISLLDGCGGGNDDSNSTGSFPIQSLPGNTNDQKILNYALTLEFLEGDLYRQALNIASGKAQTAALTQPSDYTLSVSGGGLSSTEAAHGFAYLRDFAFAELAHRTFFTTVLLAGAPQVTPNAKGYTFGTTTTPSTLKALISAVLPVEETGVRAYLGAGKYFQSLTNLQTAVAIYSTEARHVSAFHYVLGEDPGPISMTGDQLLYPISEPSVSVNTFEHFLEPAAVIAAAQKYIVK